MKGLRFIIIKNATANIIRGSASAIVALVLPHFLTRDLSVAQYSSWMLMLQIAAWSGYLDFGLQIAVARQVAQSMERNDRELRDRALSTAFLLLLAAGVLAFAIALIVAWEIPALFHNAPLSLIGELRGGLLILSAGAASLLPLSTYSGILTGLHRNEFPALAVGGTRLLGAVGVLCVVRFTHSLVWLALCLSLFNVLGGVLQYGFARRLLPDMRIRWRLATKTIARELAHYCLGMTTLNLSLLCINGLDLTIVGYFAFSATGYYAIASTVISFLIGLTFAAFNALLTPVAVLQERREYSRICDVVLSTTRLGSYLNLAIVVSVIVAGVAPLRIWVGPRYASQALPILELLLWAQAIRLTGSAYSMALVATAQQQFGVVAALSEAVINVLVSILGARFLGPIGVAWGTVVGAVCGILCLMFWVMRRAREVPVRPAAFAREAVLRPVICFAPLLLYIALREKLHLSREYLIMAILVTLLILLWAGRLPKASLKRSRIIQGT